MAEGSELRTPKMAGLALLDLVVMELGDATSAPHEEGIEAKELSLPTTHELENILNQSSASSTLKEAEIIQDIQLKQLVHNFLQQHTESSMQNSLKLS